MAIEKPAPGPTTAIILFVFLVVLAAMYIAWLYTGGPERYQELKAQKEQSSIPVENTDVVLY